MKRRSSAYSLLAAALVPVLVSCANVSEQKYLTQGSLTNVRKIVVVTSSKDVRVAGNKGALFTVLGLPFGPAGLAAGLALDAVSWGIGSAVDAHNSTAVQESDRKETISQRLSGYFTKSLSANRVFESIDEAPMDSEGNQPAMNSFDGLIRLKVTELSLEQVTVNEMSLFVEVSAEMVALRDGKEGHSLWSRTERLATGEPHTLEFFKKQGVPMLDAALASMAKRLADDLVYSK